MYIHMYMYSANDYMFDHSFTIKSLIHEIVKWFGWIRGCLEKYIDMHMNTQPNTYTIHPFEA